MWKTLRIDEDFNDYLGWTFADPKADGRKSNLQPMAWVANEADENELLKGNSADEETFFLLN